MIKLVELLTEGVYDPGILKAVFMAGGAGSGKSYAAKKIFGVSGRTSQYGLKVVNVDHVQKLLASKWDIDLKKLSDMDPKERGKLFGSSTKRTENLKKLLEQGRLGLIIDSTAAQIGHIRNYKKKLEEMGYDTMMIFVDVSVETALERNKNRDRVVPTDAVIKNHANVNKNRKELKNIFGKDYHEISTDPDFDKSSPVIKIAQKFVQSPVKNSKGKDWIKHAKNLKNSLK